MTNAIGHKTPGLRALIIISGLALMVGVNMLFFVPGSAVYSITLTVLGGVILWWLLRSVNTIRYSRNETGDMTITLPGGKTIDLAADHITSIQKLDQTPLTRRQHIGVKRLGDDRYITTSNQNLYEIHMQDGRRIIISPRSPEKIFHDILS